MDELCRDCEQDYPPARCHRDAPLIGQLRSDLARLTRELAEVTEERNRLRDRVEEHVSAWMKVINAGVECNGESLANATARHVHELKVLRAQVASAHSIAATSAGHHECRAHFGDYPTQVKCILDWLRAARDDAAASPAKERSDG